ncbi:hypothetical protein ACIQMY_28470 [Streptomyces sp. NPDC091368]|uniref:hypothetical protein n=1 Tax=Streptomyces sp. NPDC091368 TaxID=3365993 RepID=UPI0038166E0E
MPSTDLDDVADRLAVALSCSDAGAWARLDQHIRAVLPWDEHVVPPTDTPVTATALALALCGPDGRTREAALSLVGASPALLPLVVVRCADWAAPVRNRARAVLRAEVPGLAPVHLGRLTAVALAAGDRLRGGEALELLTTALREGPAVGVTGLLDSEDRRMRRLAHRIAVERGLLSPARLAVIASTGHDVVVQDLCADAALAAAGGEPDDSVLAPLLRARLGRVRAAGVTALRAAGRPGEAVPYLCDRSAVVRGSARWVLRRTGTDPLPLYRAVCADADAMPPDAPLGLAECGDRATDADTLWALTEHPRPRVRASAVAGLRLLDAVRSDGAGSERLARLLDDTSPRVVRAAESALAP